MAKFERPAGLPDFKEPPLNEVVLGVQFPPIEGYNQIHAGDVWRLFKEQYPLVEEQPPLAPVFETFGPIGAQQTPFSFGQALMHNRYWFIAPDQHELIQFQNDRFLHNWRQTRASVAEYPRFEALLSKFQTEFLRLSDFVRTLSGERSKQLTCNQVEVSYINHILLPSDAGFDPASALKVANFSSVPPDDFSMVWRRALRNSSGSPYARLSCEAQTALNHKGEKIIALTITVRGNPSVGTIGNVIEFMKEARVTIVNEFASITTDSAHTNWGRIM